MHFIDVFFELAYGFLIIIVILNKHSSDDIFELPSVFDGDTHEVPVVHDEAEVILHSDLTGNFCSISEGFTHDGDEHIYQVNHDHKSTKHKQKVKESVIRLVS